MYDDQQSLHHGLSQLEKSFLKWSYCFEIKQLFIQCATNVKTLGIDSRQYSNFAHCRIVLTMISISVDPYTSIWTRGLGALNQK